MKRLFICLLAAFLFVQIQAQVAPISWTAYGLTFDAPKGILVEEDTEDTFLLNNSCFYITIHSLDSDNMKKEELSDLLKGLADDDGVQKQSEVGTWDLEQFHAVWLKGIAEEDSCYYMCLMTKDAGSVFYVSVIYNSTDDKTVEKMLKSFKMELQ